MKEVLAASHALLASGDARIGIIGLGYVGLPLVGVFHDAGLQVLGFDVDPGKIVDLAEGRSYLRHLGDDLAQRLSQSERFSATTDLSRLDEPDAIVVCVPTPLGDHQEPNLEYVVNTARAIGAKLRAGQLVVLGSTTYPGTTRDVFQKAMMDVAASVGSQLKSGEDYFVAYSPEREDPGRSSHTTRDTPKLVGGVDRASTEIATSLFKRAIDRVVPVSSAEVAEAAKLLENIFRSVNIALVNEMKMILDKIGVNIWEVVEAASSKPFGFMSFYPGPGLGGHCIPIDPFYLSWKAKEIGCATRFIELAGEINTRMPEYVVDRVIYALNADGKAIRNSRILVLGLAYKADVDDTRESPSFVLIERMASLGARVDYSDPHIPRTKRVRKYDLALDSVELTASAISSYDAVVIATAHRAFDYGLIAENAAIIVDTRNAMGDFTDRIRGRLFQA